MPTSAKPKPSDSETTGNKPSLSNPAACPMQLGIPSQTRKLDYCSYVETFLTRSTKDYIYLRDEASDLPTHVPIQGPARKNGLN